jgi:chemotaxis protein histidine kinase CheA
MSMKTPERLFDYFTLEANEQLAILEEEASRDSMPNAGRFIAAARDLTSSAQMARLTSLAEIASGIEKIAKDVIRNKVPWTKELREAVLAGIRELRVSVARVKELDESDYVRLRRHSREVMTFTREEVPALEAVPIARLFYDDAGPHIVRLAHSDSASDAKAPAVSTRGRALKDLLDASIARLGGGVEKKKPQAAQKEAVLPVEQLLYRGRAALDRAREIGSRIRAEKRTPAEQEMTELFDLLDLAATEAP